MIILKLRFNLILYIIMFRSNQYFSRYEETPIQLDTSLISPGNGARQNKLAINLLFMTEVHILIGFMDSLKLNFLLINQMVEVVMMTQEQIKKLQW